MDEETVARLESEICDLVTARDYVSFAELTQLRGFKGNMELFIDTEIASNIVLWAGISVEAIEALRRLEADKRIRKAPASLLTYFADGAVLPYPLVKQMRHYKKPRWFPVTFRPAA